MAAISCNNDMLRKLIHKAEYVANWKLLGLFLGLHKSRLDEIERERQFVSDRKMEMLDIWLKGNPDNPETQLDDALRELYQVGLKRHRKAIDHEHLKLGDDAQKQIDCLKIEFAEIAIEASKCLQEKYPDAEIAGKWVNEVLRGTQRESLMVCSGVTASNHDDLFKHLQTKWSFTNPDNLEKLVRKLQTAHSCSLKEKIRDYKKKFKDFCHSLPLDGNTPMHFEVLDLHKPCLIIETAAIELDLDEIFAFLDDVFEIYKRYFRIHKIEPGCIKATLQFPDDMKHLIQACINQKCDVLKQFAISMQILEPQKMQDQENPSVDDSNQDESTQTERSSPLPSKSRHYPTSEPEKNHNFLPTLITNDGEVVIPCIKVEDKSDLLHQDLLTNTRHEPSTNEGTLESIDCLNAGTGHTSDYSSE